MKIIACIILLFFSSQLSGQSKQPVKPIKYVLIKETKLVPGDINQAAIDKLDEPLKAIAAYYSALGGSNCKQDTTYEETCELTMALGFGNQGSAQHKAIIQKWFPNDKAAKQILAQDCYQRPSGATSFSDYVYLSLSREGNEVTINYSLMVYQRGDISYIKGPDKVIINGKQVIVLKRSIWKKL
ncbi:MAG: hypothetical protein ABI741_07830 [Ferruginibacter sp.]